MLREVLPFSALALLKLRAHWHDTNTYTRTNYTLRAGHNTGQHRKRLIQLARRVAVTVSYGVIICTR